MKTTDVLKIELKKLRTRAGLTQQEVATKFGYTTAQFVSNWERGLITPPIKTAKRLSLMCGKNEKYLMPLYLKIEEDRWN